MYRKVEFKSEYPDDWQFDENDNPIAPGSREVADQIAAQLADHVSEVSPVDQHSYYGWSFETNFENCRFYQVLNPVDGDCYFTVQCLGYWIRKLLFKKRSADLIDALQHIWFEFRRIDFDFA